jgi:hypothetical protein
MSTMVKRKDAKGGIYEEPPYTKKEQRDFRRLINNLTGPITIVHAPREKPPQESPPQPPEE